MVQIRPDALMSDSDSDSSDELAELEGVVVEEDGTLRAEMVQSAKAGSVGTT